MRRWIVAIAAALALLVPIWAGAQTAGGVAGFCGYSRVATPASSIVASGAAFASMTISNTATGLTIPRMSNNQPVVGALVMVQTNSIRERHDGTDPTAILGMIYGSGTTGGATFLVCGSDLTKIKMIRATSSDSDVNVVYYIPGG